MPSGFFDSCLGVNLVPQAITGQDPHAAEGTGEAGGR